MLADASIDIWPAVVPRAKVLTPFGVRYEVMYSVSVTYNKIRPLADTVHYKYILTYYKYIIMYYWHKMMLMVH